jgi:hypothetical protein
MDSLILSNVARVRHGVASFIGAGVVATFLGAAVPAANAASYEVWSCRDPGGAPARANDDAGGWQSGYDKINPTGGFVLDDECMGGKSLSARLASTNIQPPGANLKWRFAAPPNTTVASYELDMDGYVRGVTDADGDFGDLVVVRDGAADPNYDFRWHGYAGHGPVPREVRRWSGAPVSGFAVFAVCSGQGSMTWACAADASPGVAAFSVYRSTVTLEDREAPVVVAPATGDAVTNSTWAGPTGISFGATDQGGGVYRMGIEVDGQVLSTVNLAGEPCRSWPGTERTFLAPKPCPSSVGGVSTFDTKDLPEGVHTVRVLVEDAAGNQATVYGPTTKRLRKTDPGPNNGTPAVDQAIIKAAWEGRESDLRSIKYNQQPVLRGQLLTAAGQPIRDAFVRVTITRDARNSPPFERESLTTNSEGRFRWRMPKGSSSRRIQLAYYQRVRDDQPVVVKTLRLQVAAGVTLRLSRTTARRGQSVRLRGTLRGRPLPKGGKVVELQARDPGGRWITFRTVRANGKGAFSSRYRFRNPGPARFQMRARVRRSGDYPYATGTSPIRSIRIR